MNEFDHLILVLLKQRERPENISLNRDSNPDLCDAGATALQLSYHVNWVQVDYQPVDVEMDDNNTGIFHVFEMRILNE